VAVNAIDCAGVGRERILQNLLVVEHFVDDVTCERLVRMHEELGSLGEHSDNGFFLPDAQRRDPEGFRLARGVVQRMKETVATHFDEAVGCDLALLCAIAGTFRHTLHADNALVVCPRHGSNAEELVRLDCQCDDLEVTPNHTPWRKYTGLLYLSERHRGGTIVFGEGPGAYGRLYRKEIAPAVGLLVLTPSNELYFHRTTPVEAGVRYSMNCWFTTEQDHISLVWQ
jgi:hypothetical protein